MLHAIERATGQTIEAMPLPSKEDIVDRRISQFKELISMTIESEDLGSFESIIASYQLSHEESLSEIAAALAFLVQSFWIALPFKHCQCNCQISGTNLAGRGQAGPVLQGEPALG